MGKVLAGLFIGVFVGALAYELLRRTELGRTVAYKGSEGFDSAGRDLNGGSSSGKRGPQECMDAV